MLTFLDPLLSFLFLLAVIIGLVKSQSLSESLVDELEPFDVPLNELEKDSKPITTLDEQCKRFIGHYRYYCRTSNIAVYNEEVRILCERYRTYCSNRIYPAINHIRRQLEFWKVSGLPKGAQQALKSCYSGCKETDPECVNACECIHLQWVMNNECYPGVKSPASPNCQRWAAKCNGIWKPRVNLTPAYSRDGYAPPPLVRGIFYGYDSLATHTTFDHPRDHGVSFWRGTNTVLVDWPEGKVRSGRTFEVPYAGVNGIFNAIDIGFPNLQKAINEFTKDNPDRLNPGTGRYYEAK